jgi:hypothetical protein
MKYDKWYISRRTCTTDIQRYTKTKKPREILVFLSIEIIYKWISCSKIPLVFDDRRRI